MSNKYLDLNGLRRIVEKIPPVQKEISLNSANWVENSGIYEYIITDSSIVEKSLVNLNMDLENQKKLGSHYTRCYNGYYKIMTGNAPSGDIVANATIIYTRGGSN